MSQAKHTNHRHHFDPLPWVLYEMVLFPIAAVALMALVPLLGK
jgi:hypothetical protein